MDETLHAFEKTAQIIDEELSAEVMGAADVMLVSRDSILASGGTTLWSAKTMVRQSGGSQSDTVAGDYQLLADKIESLSGVGGNAAKSGFHVSANREALAVQAQGGELQLNAQQSMTIGSESGEVHLTSPTRIKLQTSGGASITIDSSGVKLVCPGTIKVKAVKKGLVGGARVTVKVLDFLSSDASMSYYLIDSATERVLKNRRYRMIDPHNGHITLGKSDGLGKIEEHHPNILLEILPELSRTYTQDIGGNLPNIIVTAAPSPEKNILTAKDLNSVETILKNLKTKDLTFKANYNRRISGGYNLDSVPVVPNGAKLVTFKRLLKLKPGTGDSMFYKSFNGFASNETNFHTTINILEGDRYLPHSYYYIYAHGSNHSILWVNTRDDDPVQRALNITRSRNQYVTISGKSESQKRDAINKFYQFISSNGYTDNQTLVLLSCNVGNGLTKTIGEYIAAHPNIGTVYAPTSLTWYSSSESDPSVSSKARWIHPDKNMKTLAETKLPGHFRIFNSATTARSSR